MSTTAPGSPATASLAAGIYCHVPFCRHKCRYCDFYSRTRTERIPAFCEAIELEIARRRDPALAVDTVYIGGGTPSLLSPDAVRSLVARIREHFDLSPEAECTLEVNPGTADLESLSAYRQAGINRLSIGVQSFSEASLAFLGRLHGPDEALRVFREAREAGFGNIGLDLISGLPGQSEADCRADLERAADLGPEHLSCYLLTFEAGTPLDRDRRSGRVSPATEAEQGRHFDLTREILEARGYRRYEVSNFARSRAFESRHNRKYWTFAPYLGFGPSAHSFRDGVRSWNAPDLEGYIRALAAGGLPKGGREIPDRGQRLIEAVFLGLRTVDGIGLADFEARFGERFRDRFDPVLAALVEEGLVMMDGTRCGLTPRGFRYADGVSRRLVACI